MKENQRKDVQKKKLINTLCKNNINTVTEELTSSENIVQVYPDDIIAVHDRWIIPSTFSQQFVKKLGS